MRGPAFAFPNGKASGLGTIDERMSNDVARGAVVRSGTATELLSDFRNPKRILAERERDRPGRIPNESEDVVKPLTTPVLSRRPTASAKPLAAAEGHADLPADFVELSECLPSHSDRQLGYFGDSRFVAFRYEPRAEDVMWCDERSFGIATGAWQRFLDEVEPLAELYGFNVGSHGRSAEHVLVFDRVRHTCYFAPRAGAEALLARRRELAPATSVRSR